MNKIDGKKIANSIIDEVHKDVQKLRTQGIILKLAVVLVGDNKASLSFIKKKEELSKKVGKEFALFTFPKDIKEEELIDKINEIQSQEDITSIIVQLPLPKQLNKRKVLDTLDPNKDVDCLTSYNLGKLAAGITRVMPPTAGAVMEIIERHKITTKGKHIVVVGKGDLVGKPLSILLTQDSATMTVCNKHTENLAHYTRQADIIITATGVPGLISVEMVKEGVVVIDAGTSFIGKKLVGDVAFTEVAEKSELITPVPGGVGPITVAKLLKNCVSLYVDSASIDF